MLFAEIDLHFLFHSWSIQLVAPNYSTLLFEVSPILSQKKALILDKLWEAIFKRANYCVLNFDQSLITS